jgi:hypothetical protein
VVSQSLTLFITPVIYTYMERFQGWLSRVAPATVDESGDEVAR